MLNNEEIRKLIKLIDESSIDEFSYESNGTKVNLKKSGAGNEKLEKNLIQQPAPDLTTQPAPRQSEQEASKEQVRDNSQTKAEKEEPSASYDHEIVSPMVGTFYNSPNPESGPFVTEGDLVEEDTVVCIVEAMKLFNEIESEKKGKIVEILVGNGELVEFGQPLFRVKS